MHFGSPPASLRCSCVVLLVLGAVGLTTLPARAQDAKDSPLPTIAEKTEGMTKIDGYVPVYWDAATGKLWLEISRVDTEMLYVSSLPTGLGSNPVGLDRGQLGTQRVVRFERTGPTVLLVTPNLDYRAASDNEYERTAVREAFAPGVLQASRWRPRGPRGTCWSTRPTSWCATPTGGPSPENTGQGRTRSRRDAVRRLNT
jgi:hypothetical protein